MTTPSNSRGQLEVLWWILTMLAAAGVVLPILFKVDDYPFLITNIIYVVAFITLSRYIFLLPYTFLAEQQRIKLIVIFLCIPAVFFLVQELNRFQTYLDEEGFDGMVGKMNFEQQDALVQYIHSEMLLFGVGSIIAAMVLAFRLMISN